MRILAVCAVAFGLALVAAPPVLAKQETPTACVLDAGETSCAILCVPGVLAVTAEGPAGAWVEVACPGTTLRCGVLVEPRCWAATSQETVGAGLCRAHLATRAVCASG